MAAFEDGQHVRYVGTEGLGSKWKGREGVVKDSYRDFDGNRVEVLMKGETRAISFDEEDFEAVKATYQIKNSAGNSVWADLELTEPEAVLIRKVCEALNNDKVTYAPTLTFKRKATP
jgi:hypothetical protein